MRQEKMNERLKKGKAKKKKKKKTKMREMQKSKRKTSSQLPEKPLDCDEGAVCVARVAECAARNGGRLRGVGTGHEGGGAGGCGVDGLRGARRRHGVLG